MNHEEYDEFSVNADLIWWHCVDMDEISLCACESSKGGGPCCD